MTSAAALEPADRIRPKDLLLSGPAAGVLGALNAARRMGYEKIITFDMGGTSTDVARVDGAVGYRFSQTVGGVTLLGPSVSIETVAAGGGSICSWSPSGLAVGPHSAGSEPGPACYGKGGPLTITDVNLLLSRFDPLKASIPLNPSAAEARLSELMQVVAEKSGRSVTRGQLLEDLLALAVEHMADAIRKISVLEGYNPSDYALLAFGGAGPQHACGVAERLGIKTILIPHHAGILSAVGLQEALPERFAQTQVLRLLDDVRPELDSILAAMTDEAIKGLAEANHTLNRDTLMIRQLAEMRLRGQDTPLQIEFHHGTDLGLLFTQRYEQLFGYSPPATKPVELVSLRVAVSPEPDKVLSENMDNPDLPETDGPALIQDAFSTLHIADGWHGANKQGVGWVLKQGGSVSLINSAITTTSPDILRHRLTSIVEEMGALLRRTALSTNIRERLDFSCAVLNADGQLLTSAPHIPVHLGALGACVRSVKAVCPMAEGDTVITNHPAYGGSHLPDVTLITPLFDAAHTLIGFVANRAHHAEIGGISPGSMPANAKRLVEEGVVIAPTHLVRGGTVNFDAIRNLLTTALYPTRAFEDNIADLHAQLAANRLGLERVRTLAPDPAQMQQIFDASRHVMNQFAPRLLEGSSEEFLDDGSPIRFKLQRGEEGFILDFTGTAPQHKGNLNATPAIVRSAVLYSLRLALQDDLPLNEGLLADVEILLPEGALLNPHFPDDPAECPAVVGGNVEISQRVVDTVLKALGIQACSQGTMNNFLFGNDRFGYYETICGGTGAGDGYHGATAQHSHMTNTAITDPEIIERRYPVRLRQFALRQNSGGQGAQHGGDGVIREFEFTEPLTVSMLTQHRTTGPYGMHGGSTGAPGKQTLIRISGLEEPLSSSATLEVQPGECIRLETPGGGGWGEPPA